MRGTAAIYFQSLNRPFNILGVDRKLFFLFVGLCLPIAFSAQLAPIMDCIALTVFAILHIIGVFMTRLDNQMLIIYRRHIHYKKYYTANAGIHSTIPPAKPSVPSFSPIAIRV